MAHARGTPPRLLAAGLGCLALLLPCGAPAGEWSAELFAGTAWNVPTSLALRQAGYPELRIRPRYETRPFSGAPYYAWRIGRGDSTGAWEIELVHHKLHLANRPPEVQEFELSHGYNLLTLDRATPLREFVVRLGIGLVVAHPEGRARGRALEPVGSRLGGGYHVAGLAGQVAVARPLPLGRGFALVPELKLSASRARVPLAGGGEAVVPNLALHAHAGLRYAR